MPVNGEFGVFSLASALGQTRHPSLGHRGQTPRQRRRHAKSRRGCVPCKQRRVKCDEGRPACVNCSARSLKCHFDSPSGDDQDNSVQPLQISTGDCSNPSGTEFSNLAHLIPGDGDGPVPPPSPSPGVMLLDMRLMYHFEHTTADTMLFGAGIWRDQVLPLALECEYLMSAVLMLSASHLHHLHPKAAHHSALVRHLDRALAGFRFALNQPLMDQNADILIACGFVFLHYAWSNPCLQLENADRLMSFAAGIRAVISSINAKQDSSLQIFREVLAPTSVAAFKQWAASSASCHKLDELFLSRHRSTLSEFDTPLITDASCWTACGALDAAERVSPILHAVESALCGDDISHLMPEIRAYTMMWPAKASSSFAQELEDKSPRALVVMLAFYASAWRLLVDDVWWMRKRTRAMCGTILTYFNGRDIGSWRTNVDNICTYFGFESDTRGRWRGLDMPPYSSWAMSDPTPVSSLGID